VYEAYDRHVGRRVALKRLLDPAALRVGAPARVVEARFFREAATLQRIRSPHVVALYDLLPRERLVALELCHGGNLVRAMRRGLIGAAALPRIAQQLRNALLAIHGAGAIHRDIKPANILIREPRSESSIAVADFGLALEHLGEAPGSAAGPSAHAGTLRYLAPELRRPGSHASAASDLFSAGVVLLELARAPAPLPSALDRIDATLDAREFVPEELPEPWRGRLRSLLSPDPQDRAW
jgi:serine/threonine protein kinase